MTHSLQENHEDSYEELLRKKKDAERRYRALLGEVPKVRPTRHNLSEFTLFELN